jgi:hypothetical protein
MHWHFSMVSRSAYCGPRDTDVSRPRVIEYRHPLTFDYAREPHGVRHGGRHVAELRHGHREEATDYNRLRTTRASATVGLTSALGAEH